MTLRRRAFVALGVVLCLLPAVASVGASPLPATAAASQDPPTQLLAVGRSGEGIVTSTPPGITCGTDCSEHYADATVVTLVATPAYMWRFLGWSGDCTGIGPCVVTMDRLRAVNAQFDRLEPTQPVVVTKAGAGSGTVTSAPGGIDCGTACTASFATASTPVLTATPDPGSVFAGWSGACGGTGACTFAVDGPKAVVATFDVARHRLGIAVEPALPGGWGSVTIMPGNGYCDTVCAGEYDHGTVVTLTATPTGLHAFLGWSGACSGTGACVLTMDAGKNVVATFGPAPAGYTLTVAKLGGGSGTVTSLPAGITCGADCTEDYAVGETVELTAVAAVGSTFVEWGGACSGSGACSVTMDAAKMVTATFALQQFRLGLAVDPAIPGPVGGSVTANPGGFTCDNACAQLFDYGTILTVTPSPLPNSRFIEWGGACSGSGACVVTMDADKGVTALFGPINHTLTVSLSGTGAGSVSSNPPGIACAGDCTEDYQQGTVVTLTATPGAFATFTGWSGGGCAGTGACVVTMDAAKSVQATFTAVRYTLTLTRLGAGTGTVVGVPGGGLPDLICGTECSGTFDGNTVVTLLSSAATGSMFSGWGGACAGRAECTVTMDQAREVTAQFDLPPQRVAGCRDYQVSVAANQWWQDSNIAVQAGQTLYFTARGPWGDSAGQVDANGRVTQEIAAAGVVPLPGIPIMTLVGRIGAGGQPIRIGSDWVTTADADGSLFFVPDDRQDILGDNTGSVAVTVGVCWPPHERILWSSDRAASQAGESHIWMMLPDGSGAQQVTFGQVADTQPALSPDGRRLAFTRTTAGCPTVMLKDLETGTETPLDPFAEMPTWAPSSNMVLYSTFGELVQGQGCDPGNRTPAFIAGKTILGVVLPPLILPPDGATRLWPAWAPDGSQVLYSRVAGAFSELWTKPTAGAELPVAQLPSNESRARFAYDNPLGRIAWVSDALGQTMVMAGPLGPPAVGAPLTPPDGSNGPAWSPNSLRIALFKPQGLGAVSDIWTIASTGGAGTNLTPDLANDIDPWWGTLGDFTTPTGAQPWHWFIASGTDGAGRPGAPCASDPLVHYRLSPAGTLAPAVVGSGMPGSPCTVFNTVGGIASQTVTTADIGDDEAWFEFSFALPEGASNATLNLILRGDDGADVTLDGAPMNPPDPSDWSTGTAAYTADQIGGGTHTVQIHVVRSGTDTWNGGTPTGNPAPTDALDVEFEATVTQDEPHTLTVSLIGSGSGTVTSVPAGIACGIDCTETYGPAALVTLTPTPAPGSRFVGWTGSPGCGDIDMPMIEDTSCTAEFRVVYDLTWTIDGTGSGSVTADPAGTACGVNCRQYDENELVELTATPAPGSEFIGWSGSGCSGTGTCQVTMDAARSVTATFHPVPGGTAVRTLPACVSATARTVSILVTPVASVRSYAVEDIVPLGWTVSGISHGGVFDAKNHKVKWGPFTSPLPPQGRTLTYLVQPSSAADGIFSGLASFEQQPATTTGDLVAPVCSSHPADVVPDPAGAAFGDWRMTAVEVTSYAGAWQRGNPWPYLPSPIPIEYVTLAGSLWATCEDYKVNYAGATIADIWVPNCTAAPVFRPDAARRTTPPRRTIDGCYADAKATPVRVVVTPKAGTRAWAIEEKIPAGWTVRFASDNGVFDAATGVVRWGPFFDAGPRTVSYTVVPLAGDKGARKFAGQASFNGSRDKTAGVAAIARCRAK